MELICSSHHGSVMTGFAAKLCRFGPLNPDDLAAVHRLANGPLNHVRGEEIHLHATPLIITEGWACRTLPGKKSRRRQIFGFLVPGDVVGSFRHTSEFSALRVVALTHVVTVSAGALIAVDEAGDLIHRTVVEAAGRAEDHDQRLVVNQMVRLGGRDAYRGLTHLLLELHERMDHMGLVEEDAFSMPVGQRVLARALGISVTHTNHTLRRMAADGLFRLEGRAVRLLCRDRMVALADFPQESRPKTQTAQLNRV